MENKEASSNLLIVLKEAAIHELTLTETCQCSGGWNTKEVIWWGIFALSIVSGVVAERFYTLMQYKSLKIPKLRSDIKRLSHEINGPLGLKEFIIPDAKQAVKDLEGMHKMHVNDRAHCTKDMINTSCRLALSARIKLLELNTLQISKTEALTFKEAELSQEKINEANVRNAKKKKYHIPFLAAVTVCIGSNVYNLFPP